MNEMDLLLVRNGGAFICAITKIIQKKVGLLAQEVREFLDNFTNVLFN